MKKLNFEVLYKIKNLTQKEIDYIKDFLYILRGVSNNEEYSTLRQLKSMIESIGEKNEKLEPLVERINYAIDLMDCHHTNQNGYNENWED